MICIVNYVRNSLIINVSLACIIFFYISFCRKMFTVIDLNMSLHDLTNIA